MKIKTSELTGYALDRVVAKCEGLNEADFVEMDNLYGPVWRGPEYSTDWAFGGPIIERECIELLCENEGFRWVAIPKKGPEWRGPTPLIAAMRCYVVSKMGDEIELPDELQEEA